jgi:hypothetical protein
MKRILPKFSAWLIALALIQFSFIPVNAQEGTEEQTTTEQEQPDNRPVRGMFETGQLIDNQTPLQPLQGGFELLIHHRMGKVKELSDLFGIYSASNIRLGFNYGITDKIMVGFGTEKDRKLQEFSLKYNLLTQTRSGSVPLSLSLYGNMSIDAREKSYFEAWRIEYRQMHRLSYFTQLIAARKFSDAISFQVAPSFVYFNAVDQKYNNMNLGISAGGRIKIAPQLGAIIEYDQSFLKSDAAGAVTPKPNFAIGIEKGTATHCFQVFVSSYRSISNQYDLAMNEYDFFGGDVHVGFNITVRF